MEPLHSPTLPLPTWAEEICRRYAAEPKSITLLGGFANNVYSLECHGMTYVLKVHPYHSSAERTTLAAELKWMKHLSLDGVRLTLPIQSEQGEWIEHIQLPDEEYLAVVYEKAPGRLLQDHQDEAWNSSLFYKLGQSMGQMHRLASEIAASHELNRIHWHEEQLIQSPPAVSERVLEQWNAHVHELRSWSTEPACYGIVHHDLHPHNFYVNGDELVLFDFGDCLYHWYSYDIAITLYHSLQFTRITDAAMRTKWAIHFIEAFGKGYTAAYRPLTKQQLEQISFLLNYRRIYSYLYFKAHAEWESLDEGSKAALERMRTAIEQEQPVIEAIFTP